MFLTKAQARNKTFISYLVAQLTDEPISHLVPLTNGLVSYSYEVNNHLIVKFPSFITDLKNWHQQVAYSPILYSCAITNQRRIFEKNVFFSCWVQYSARKNIP